MTEDEIFVWAQREGAEVADLLADLSTQYELVRMLPDGSIAGLSKLAYTTGIFLGLNRIGWGARFCFNDRALALRRFGELQSEDDRPAGFIARRGG